MALEKIILVRHDTTPWNGDKVQGDENIQLKKGSASRLDEVADLIVEEEKISLPQDTPIYFIGSGLDRVYDTVERIHIRLHRKHGYKSEFFYTPDLNERGQGELQGLSFEEVLEIMAPGSNLDSTAENVYPILYSSDKIPGGESHKDVTDRLTKVILDYVVPNEGIGIFGVHQQSGMNLFQNLLIHGNTLIDRDGSIIPYRHKLNLSVVRLELDQQNSMRYVVTGEYGPPGVMEATAKPGSKSLVVSNG